MFIDIHNTTVREHAAKIRRLAHKDRKAVFLRIFANQAFQFEVERLHLKAHS